jgi:hypothetical protein
MDNLENIGEQLSKLRIGKIEDFVFDSSDPLSEILNYFKKDCKSFETGIEDDIKYTRLIMATNFLGQPREVVTIQEYDGELFQVGIHGNNDKLVKEYNKLTELLQALDKEPETYIGKLGERNGTTYFGNLFSDYIFGVAKNVQVNGDTLQVFVKNFFKS